MLSVHYLSHFFQNRAKIQDQEILRPYTPISSDDDIGYFDLVLKIYPKGKMTQHILSLKVGDTIDVKGPKGRFVYEKNKYSHISMIAGGTGITPMLQIITEILKRDDDTTKISLLFGNVTFEDIILKDRLDSLANKHSDQFTVYYVLDKVCVTILLFVSNMI